MKDYRAGIDIGSTTVKLVVLDDNDHMIYGKYRRHLAHTQATLNELMKEAKQLLRSHNREQNRGFRIPGPVWACAGAAATGLVWFLSAFL